MYLALVLLLSWGLMCSNEEDIMEKFVPTSEWAEIKEGFISIKFYNLIKLVKNAYI